MQFKPFVGPLEYSFVDPDTGHIYRASSKSELIKRIVSYRSQNRLEPIDALGLVIDNYLCSLPVHLGMCQPIPKLRRGFLQYAKGGVALLKNLFYGADNMVSDVEANRRAKICTGCKYNVFPDKGPFLKWSDSIAEASTSGRKSEYHSILGNCGVCSCLLKAKVFYKGPFELEKEQEKQMAEVGCWQVEKKN